MKLCCIAESPFCLEPLERQEALRCFLTSSAVDSWHDDQLEGEALAVRVASRVRSRIASTASASIFAASAETLTLDTTRPFPSSSQRERSFENKKTSSQVRSKSEWHSTKNLHTSALPLSDASARAVMDSYSSGMQTSFVPTFAYELSTRATRDRLAF